MFTGIATNAGKIVEKSENKLRIQTEKSFINKLSKGASVAVDGICLTVTNFSKDSFSVDYMPETKKRTNIQYLKVGDLVNLELPATLQTFLSGSIMQGHIDSVSILKKIEQKCNSKILTFSIPKNLGKYIVKKGTIAVNGISLTVVDVKVGSFTVGIIPYTWEKTMLYTARVGDYVNIEVDILAKYIEKLVK
ncbi:MAG: riboflavin synthase [Candidatus Levyibacteriota bacterium]